MTAKRYAESKWKPEVREAIDAVLDTFNIGGHDRPKYDEAYGALKGNLPRGAHVSYTSFLLYADHRREELRGHPGKSYGPAGAPINRSSVVPHNHVKKSGLHGKLLRLERLKIPIHRLKD